MRRTPPVLLLLGVLAPLLAHGQLGVRTGTGIPPRLALVEGQASFWRPGSAEWTSARGNTPLGTGDGLYTGPDTSVEMQMGPASFLRLGAATYLELSDVAQDQLQLKLSVGEAALDLRDLAVRTIEIDTPQAAIMLERPGHYRLHVDKHSATLIVRRGGSAAITSGSTPGTSVRTGEEAVVTSEGAVHRFAAPDLDAWDRWSLARTDRLVDTLSARYVAEGIYGLDDLDQAGTWREIEEYGPVWFPDAVPPGWVPFSTGTWIYDSTFGWTWVDDMPWGWAPSHHGRWVSVDGRWGWAPGPPEVVPAYAPATVGWLEGGPGIAWVPLGWGEPIFPWWGAPGTAGVASWAGWGGPWVVNRAPIQQRGAIYASSMNYTNAPNAVIATRSDRFGRGVREFQRATPDQVPLMRARDAGPGTSPVASSLAPTSERGLKPSGSLTGQRVVATRMPPDAGARLREFGLKTPGTGVVQLVLPPPRTMPSTGDRPPDVAGAPSRRDAPSRAAVGDTVRARPPRAPGFIDWLRGAEAAETAGRQVPRDLFASSAGSRGFEPPMGEAYRTDLPGEPAMRLRPSGGPGGFAAGAGERREAPRIPAAPPPPPPAAPPPTFPIVTASVPTTSSTMVVTSTTFLPTTSYPPPTIVVTTTTYPPPTLPVTTTTLPPPPPIATTAQAGGFQYCTRVGDACGPCQPSGEMALCMRQIGTMAPICAQPSSCYVMSCLWDSDCGTGRRCVQDSRTMKTNCCDECAGYVGEHRPRFVELATPTTTSTIAPLPVTTTTLAAPPPTFPPPTIPPPAAETTEFLACSEVGAACGPCVPGGEMALCMRQIGTMASMCVLPRSCYVTSCLWDRDCGPGRRCVQNARTMQTNCCDECAGVAGEPVPRYVAGAPTTTSSTMVVPRLRPTTSTTLAPPPPPVTEYQACTGADAPCGPCLPSGKMSLCARHVGGTEAAICTQPDACEDRTCLSDRDCGPARRCVMTRIEGGAAFLARRWQTSCCEECQGLGQDDLFDAPPTRGTAPAPPVTTTTSTLPPPPPPPVSADYDEEEEPFRRCVAPGETCGPCGESGFLTICQREIGTGRVLCPKQGSCVDKACAEASDCLSHQRCVFNSITMRSNCCEVCE